MQGYYAFRINGERPTAMAMMGCLRACGWEVDDDDDDDVVVADKRIGEY